MKKLFLLFALALAATASAATPPQKLNVVLILADDLGWTDIAPFGSDLHETPALDRSGRTERSAGGGDQAEGLGEAVGEVAGGEAERASRVRHQVGGEAVDVGGQAGGIVGGQALGEECD